MKRLTIILFSVILVLIQVSITSFFKIGWLNYNFALVSIILVSWLFDKSTTIINAVVIGFLYDLSASPYVGYYTLMFVGICFLLMLISKAVYQKSAGVCLIITFVLSIITELMTYMIFYFKYTKYLNTFALSKIIFPQSLINCILCFVLFFAYNAMYYKLGFNEKRW